MLLVFVEQRQLPGAVVGILTGPQQLPGQLLVVAHQAGGLAAQGDDAGAGQGGDVDHRAWLEAFDIGQRVAEHQAAFGVGIEDFDGLAAQGGDDVARAGGAAAGHVLGAGQHAHQVDRQLQFQRGAESAEHAGGAAHVVLHFIHAQAGLEADAAGIEGNALAHQRVGLLALLAAVVLHHDDAAWLVAALGHGEERTGAQFAQFLLVQHFDLQALEVLAQLPGLLGDVAGVTDVGRQVAQVTGEIHAGGDGLRMVGGLLDLRLFGLVAEQGDPAQRAGIGLLALEPIEYVLSTGEDFHQGAGAGIGIASLDLHILQGEGRIAATEVLQGACHRRDHLAPLAVVQFVRLAGADQQHAFGLDAGQLLEQQSLARLALQVAALEYRCNRACAGCIDALRGGSQDKVFADGQNQGGHFDDRRFRILYNKFHGVESPRQRVGFAG